MMTQAEIPQTEWEADVVPSHGTLRLTVRLPDKTLAFALEKNTVRFTPDRAQRGQNWQDLVSPAQKDFIVNNIVARYREYAAQSDEGMRYAALGILENGNMYVGVSTQTRGDPYFKDCAEQNMINAAVQSETLAANLAKKRGHPLPLIREIYEMGGAEPGNAPQKPTITCPCGVCTDMLAKYMVPGGRVVVLPVNDGTQLPSFNTAAQNIFKLNRGEAWATTIGHLNQWRQLKVADADTLEWMRQNLRHIAAKPAEALQEDTPLPLFQNGTAAAIVTQAMRNAETMRRSDPTLDVIMRRSSHMKPLAEYMRAQITLSVEAQLKMDEAYRLCRTPEERLAYIQKKFDSVRCAVVKLADGSYHLALSSISSYARAKPNAVVTAIAGDEWSAAPVQEVWYMELNPQAAERGGVMTPPKEALERVIKHARNGNPQIHILPPLCTGRSEEEWQTRVKPFSSLDLMPGMFNGKQAMAHMQENAKPEAQREPERRVQVETAQIAGVLEKRRYTARLNSFEM